MFKIGEMVVCVDDSVKSIEFGEWGNVDVHDLKRGEVYTIRGLEMTGFVDDAGNDIESLGVWLEETQRKRLLKCPDGELIEIRGDAPWGATRFRSLLKRNVEIVESLLAPVREMEDA